MTATTIPLTSAYLCECGSIGNSAHACPACGNELGLLCVASVLNRPVPFTTSDACLCQPLGDTPHHQCPMHGEVHL
jgi:hypothetical protein